MSPTVFRSGDLRFYFFSREESRMHVHVAGTGGEAKFWLEPEVGLAQNLGLKLRDITRAERLIKKHEAELHAAWKDHFER